MIQVLKKRKKIAFRVLILMVFFYVTLLVDGLMNLLDNPITLILLMIFWIGLIFVLIPSFIKKYWKLVVFIYGPILLYFLYLRLFSGGLEAYLKIRGDFPFYLFLLPIPPLFLVWAFEQWKWLQNLKAEKSKTELSLLKSQINPHFFFNTLNNLYALTIKNSKHAPEVILKLSDMMRYAIYEGKKEFVLLKDEVTYLESYIELHRIRYHKSVSIKFDYCIEDGDTIAPLLFIILLENALKHGVEKLTEDAFVKMNLKSSESEIHFSIENNFDPKEISLEKGIGLTNLKQRLSLTYPKRHQLVINENTNTYRVDLKITRYV
ncbi:sensor histidine kinase [Wocania ichthyoenteri]|uniref:sensor histidine kinase n=1 Tax=Wocania ichthyoenteri TaxID=1230531 RepID=UPI0009DD39D7|nr:sensor histidine kinase [Wocania ichthyoenteri]